VGKRRERKEAGSFLRLGGRREKGRVGEPRGLKLRHGDRELAQYTIEVGK